ncbi:hypothetical protein CVT25_006635 [Psilocybe cyanescens]|uniref:Uncharacterized protein n=1 Tax=Psilocybe cyanescens TaxID=93625 RepID=A0A409XIU1_PSICY|nr:hypothetical protein CVT25_006635 [Psilocybe cyanescens]
MAKLQSKAQITQTLGLSKARNATCDLVKSGPFLCSPVPKTCRQIDSKKFTDKNLRLKKSIKALEKNLQESGAQIVAHALDLEAKDRTILDLQANLERSNSADRILNQKYLEIVKSLETVSGDLKNVKKRTQRLIHDCQIAKAKHNSDIQKLVQDHQMAEEKHTTHIQTLTANINETSKSSGDALTALSLANELIEKFKASLNHEKTVSTEL